LPGRALKAADRNGKAGWVQAKHMGKGFIGKAFEQIIGEADIIHGGVPRTPVKRF
jgi:hypothetical protein